RHCVRAVKELALRKLQLRRDPMGVSPREFEPRRCHSSFVIKT
ncbi:unnamed protein product, partial [Mycena citricolor]